MKISHKITLILLIVFSSCSQIRTIRNNKINTTELDEGKLFYSYKKKPMNGIFKIRYGQGEYSLVNLHNGFLHGKKLLYRNRDIYKEANYKNGLLTGDLIWFSGGVKKTQYTLEDGLPNGIKLVFAENGQDTIRSLIYVTTPFKMDIYVDNLHDAVVDAMGHIILSTELCALKAEEFVQSYYLKKDSTLLKTKVWIKTGDCLYIREEERDLYYSY